MNSAIRSFVLLALSPVFLGMSGYPSKYSAEAIEARVVDADTKQPLEGVIVTANWELEDSTFAGNVPVGQLMVMEAVTDRNGRFHFPAWGPRKPSKGGLRNKDPQLLLFKPGYRSRGLVNEFRERMYEEPVRRSEWSGKTIEMKRFTGTPEEWFKMLERSIPSFGRREDYKQSMLLKAILAEENSIPDSIEDKRLFFDNIVRRLLEGR